jgi:predicted permease
MNIDSTVARAIVRLSAWLVPRDRRTGWLEEWTSELSAVGSTGGPARQTLVRRALGAPSDALTLRAIAVRRNYIEWCGGLVPDAQQAVRVFATHPGHAAAVAACLGLGLTAALGTFAVVSGLFFAPFPGIADRSTLSALYVEEQIGRFGSVFLAPNRDEFEFIRQRTGTIPLAAEGVLDLAARVGDEAVPVTVAVVSGNYFDLLGTRADAGRLLLPSDDRPDSLVAVVGNQFRSRHLGQAWSGPLVVSGRQVVVVGVAEAGFTGASGRSALHDSFAPVDIWVPLATATAWAETGEADVPLRILARLPEGLSNHDAEGLLEPPISSLAAEGRRRRPHLQRFGLPSGATPSGMALFAAAMMAAPLIVVAIACANVANLRLARATARMRELAVRLALGATRAQLVRLLVLESLVLAAAGTAVGGLGSWLGLKALTARLPLPLDLDLRVAAFTIALLAGVTVLAGLAPALVTTRRLMRAGLRQNQHGGGPSHSRFRHVMVATQVALSLGLLIIAALLARSLQTTIGAQPNLGNLLVVDIDVSRLGYDGPATRRLAADLAARVSGDTRVQGVAYSDQSLFSGLSLGLVRPGDTEPSIRADPVHVTPDWFSVLGVERLAGRTLDAVDVPGTAVVIDSRLASQLAPDGTPIGMTLRLRPAGRQGPSDDVSVHVVGVVSDAPKNPNSRRPDPGVYLPLSATLLGGADFPTTFTLFVRSADPTAIRREIAHIITDLEPRGPWTRIDTAEARMWHQRSGARNATLALSVVGLVALVLAAAGLYAAVAYLVSLRSREIGIRLAIGARPGDAARLVLRHALAPVGSGIAAGLLIAAPIAQLLRASFVGISAFDPISVLSPVLVLAMVAVVSAVGPARRAARLDPVRILRAE